MTGRPRSTRGRLLRHGAAAGAGLLAVALGGGVASYTALQGNIASRDVSGLLGDDRPAQADPGADEPPLNILIVGSDTRDFEGGEDFGGTEASTGLSDTTILLHLSEGRESATLVSLPRDLLVDAPSCQRPDGTTAPPRRIQINAAYATGGIACTIRTVEAVTDLYIDHYVVVDFLGFERMVDAVGGVEVCLEEPVRDELANLDLPAGRQVVDGEQALGYVRARKSFGDGSDLGRISRQQAFLASMVQKVTSTGVLLRPDRLYRLLDAATESITTDPALASLNELRKVAQSLQDLPPEEVRFVTAPNDYSDEDPNRLELTPQAEALWTALRHDAPLPGTEPEATPTAPPTTAPLSVPPDEVAVAVVNAGARGGAASDAAEALEVQGFRVVETTNGEQHVQGVVVQHGYGGEEAARTLAAAFPGAVVEIDPQLGDELVVLLGEGAPSAVEVPNRLPGPPLPTPSTDASGADEASAPTPTITARTATADVCGEAVR